MSQAGAITAAGSTPSIPTSFTTDSGSAVPVANVLQIVTAVPVTTNDVNRLTTSGATNVVTLTQTNTFQGTGTVVGALSTDLVTFDLGVSAAVYRFEFRVAGRETTLGYGVGYTLWASAATDGATAVQVGTSFTDQDENGFLNAATLTFVVSGNNIIVRATGVATFTVTYNLIGTYIVV